MRKSYSPEFKSKVVLEVPGKEKTLNEVASEHSVHPTLPGCWKNEAVKNLPLVFQAERKKKDADPLLDTDELPGLVGHRKAKIEWPEKKSGQFAGILGKAGSR